MNALGSEMQAIKDGLFVDIVLGGVAKTGNAFLLGERPQNALAGGESVGTHRVDRVLKCGFGIDEGPAFVPEHLNDVFQE